MGFPEELLLKLLNYIEVNDNIAKWQTLLLHLIELRFSIQSTH